MAVGPSIDPKEVSQILGSDVLIVSFYRPMEFWFHEGDQAELQWETEHMSAYILKYMDDADFKHSAKFGPDGDGHVRVSFAFRWLSRRSKVFCGEVNDTRKHREAIHNPDAVLLKQFPNSEEFRDMFSMK